MITIATVEGREAINYAIRTPYALSSMLAKYLEAMKTTKLSN